MEERRRPAQQPAGSEPRPRRRTDGTPAPQRRASDPNRTPRTGAPARSRTSGTGTPAPRSGDAAQPRRRTQARKPRKKQAPKLNIKQYDLPGWIFLPLMGLFCEMFLYFWSMDEFMFTRCITVAAFGLGLGFLLAFISSLFPPKAGKWINFALALILVVVYMAEYFIDDAFTNFMSFGTILAGGEGVATNYFDVVMTLLGRNLWRIFLVLIPIVAYAVFAKVPETNWKQRGLVAVDGILLYVLAFGVIYAAQIDVIKLTLAYNFDTAVRSFGLQMAFVLDTAQNSNMIPEDMDFEIMDGSEYQNEEATLPEGYEPVKPIVIEPHTMGLDFNTLAENESNSNIKSLHQYVASLTPANTNAYTGMFEGKNLIFITAEAFTGAFVDPELTPTLYRLIHEGIYFSDYYQPGWGAGTIGGEYSNVVGMMPVNGQCMQEAAQQELLLTMGNQLQKQGYVSGAFHNNDYTYYSRHQTHTKLGYDIWMAWGNGMENGISRSWPQSDLEMVQYILPQYLEQNKPFNLYFMSVSGHANYSRSGNNMSRKNYSYVENLDYSEQLKCYIAANLELEFALQYIVEQLEAAGIADDTVIVVSADHYPYGLEKSSTWGNDETYLNELFGEVCDSEFVRDQNNLIIWSGCVEDMDIVVDAPTYSLDILPTLSNLFGLEYDSRLMVGRDVFSTEEAIIFFGGAGSWKTELGTYSSRNGKFTPAEGVEVPDGYVDRINAIVRNKITFCRSVAKYDYFNYIAAALEE